jgi:hypothetical protein
MQLDPKKKNDKDPKQSNPKADPSRSPKDESSRSGGMGGMIGEGRADEGSRGGMKGEQ